MAAGVITRKTRIAVAAMGIPVQAASTVADRISREAVAVGAVVRCSGGETLRKWFLPRLPTFGAAVVFSRDVAEPPRIPGFASNPSKTCVKVRRPRSSSPSPNPPGMTVPDARTSVAAEAHLNHPVTKETDRGVA